MNYIITVVQKKLLHMQSNRFSCLTVDSIRLMSDAAGLPKLTDDVANYMSEDVALKTRLIISRALKFMRHANRSILSCADINRALRWSDCQPIFGYQGYPTDEMPVIYNNEARVFTYQEKPVDLKLSFNRTNQNVDHVRNALTDNLNIIVMKDMNLDRECMNICNNDTAHTPNTGVET